MKPIPWQKPANERHPLELLHGALAWTHRMQMAEIVNHGPNLTDEYAALGQASLSLQGAVATILWWEGLGLSPSTEVPLTGKPAPRILRE